MGTIIQLDPQRRAAAPPPPGATPTHCEIVIFPGVRIEREGTPYRDDATVEPGTGTDDRHRPRKSS